MRIYEILRHHIPYSLWSDNVTRNPLSYHFLAERDTLETTSASHPSPAGCFSRHPTLILSSAAAAAETLIILPGEIREVDNQRSLNDGKDRVPPNPVLIGMPLYYMHQNPLEHSPDSGDKA